MPTISKAQQFVTAVEALGDWTVEKKKEGEVRKVKATRGEEAFVFSWIRNEKGRDNFRTGAHFVAGVKEPFANVKGALRLMDSPAGTIKVLPPKQRKIIPGSTPAKVEKPVFARIPFDPYADSANEIIERLQGRKVTWTNSLSGEDEEGSVLVHGKHTKIEHLEKDREDWSRRILTFCSETGFRSLRLSAIVGVR